VSESIEKLRPDRDLQCFFFRPSAIAALSSTSASGFTLSGTWRQQFDWAVIEWTRDNTFEHPALRYLPDGDLSGLTLSYKERRTNCILIDSNLFPTVDWPYLRIWAEDGSGQEQLYRVRLADHATPTEGSFKAASATFTLSGTLTAGDVVELSWRDEHYFRTIESGDTIASVLEHLSEDVNALSSIVSAGYSGPDGTITLTNLQAGEDGNNLGVIASVSGAQTETWTPESQTMSGGASPAQWRIELNFGAMQDLSGEAVPTEKIRKMRWTYAAALQEGGFSRTEFDVEVSEWSVTGENRTYAVSGPRSRRYEDDCEAELTGTWTKDAGNFSGGTIHRTNELGAAATVQTDSQFSHRLLLGTRKTFEAGTISVNVDGGPAVDFDLFVPEEDFLIRLDLGVFGAGQHTVQAVLTGANDASGGNSFYFDFVEAAVEVDTVSGQAVRDRETLATDWDTDHSLALAPERVAWNLDMLGFKGRPNHFVGSILFYELENVGNVFASGTVTFEGTPEFSQVVEVVIDGTVFSRVTLSTDTKETIARAFEFLVNDGSTGVRASSSGNVLTIHSRLLGSAGNSITLSASPISGSFEASASGETLTGGTDGVWYTDTAANPRINRAARDWHRSYFQALVSYGMADAAAAFSMELSHGNPSAAAGLAQRYPDGEPVIVSTPAVQTNFSPASLGFWKQAYLEMAAIQSDAGMTPYLQFGEVQWWYFPNAAGMTFYDDYTKSEFEAEHGTPLHVFTSNNDPPEGFPEEAAFLKSLIGNFTSAIRSFVRASYPDTRFEVLYPHDVNDFPLTRSVNFPSSDWSPGNIEVLKTENFTYTGNSNLNKALESIKFPFEQGFPRPETAHLIGVFTASVPWDWERRLAKGQDVESVVLWAFDQFSMIGYSLPLFEGLSRSRFLG